MWKKLNTSYDIEPTSAGLKFHGLSTPEELIKMWRELKHDEDDKDLNVIFEYTRPDQLKEGFNILNIIYDSKEPNKTGHYVLVSNLPNYKEYFDPIAENTINYDSLEKLKAINDYFNDELNISLEGQQEYNNSDCGYHCLTHALNLYNSKSQPGGKLPKNPTKQDILLDLLKINRAIYYQLKTFTDGQIVKSIAALQTQGMKDKLKLSKIKKDIKNANQTVGKGISDDYDVDMLKNVNYNQLKEIMEK